MGTGLQDYLKPELNVRVVRSLAYYFRRRFGDEALEEIFRETGLDSSLLEREHNWVSLSYRDQLLAAMMAYAKDPKFAYEAGRYTSRPESIGIAYSILAHLAKPRFLYKKVLALAPHYNKVGSFHMAEDSDERLPLPVRMLDSRRDTFTCYYIPVSEEYFDEGPGAEFRLGQLVAVPNLCGMPDAEVEHEVVPGPDGRRVFWYRFHWQHRRVPYELGLIPVLGLLLGLGCFWLPLRATQIMSWLSIPSLGLAIAVILYFRRQSSERQKTMDDQQDGLIKINGELVRKVELLDQSLRDLDDRNQKIQHLNQDLSRQNLELESALRENRALAEELRNLNSGLVTELQQKNQKLEEEGKAKDRFFARINHELRVPMTLVLPSLEAILGDKTLALPPAHRELLVAMQESASRQLGLVNKLLELDKIAQGKMKLRYELLDLNKMLSALAVQVRLGLPQELELVLDLDPALPQVKVDQDSMESMLGNLLSNALKYTEKGTITLRTRFAQGEVLVSVQDTGPGIPMEKLANLFEPFSDVGVTAYRGYGSTGLGLSLVNELIRMHRGRVVPESEVGKGTTFTLHIPESSVVPEFCERRNMDAPHGGVERRADHGPDQAESEKPYFKGLRQSDFHRTVVKGTPAVAGRPTLLVVDDDKDVLYLLSGLLRTEFNVVTEDSRFRALETARACAPDIILSDVNMQTESAGFALTRELKNDPQTRHIPVILMSGRPRGHWGGATAEASWAGADDYVEKPFSLSGIRARIQLHLDRKLAHQELERKNAELKEKNARIEELAHRDMLTGVYNRRYLDSHAGQLMTEAVSRRVPLSCLMLDVDHFKTFNSLYTHLGGDEVLRQLGQLLRDWFGNKGLIARYGGEEFVVLLPRYSMKEAFSVAGSFREEVANRAFRLSETTTVSTIRVSIGVMSSFPDSQIKDYEQLLQEADEALLVAKRSRNTVVSGGQVHATSVSRPFEEEAARFLSQTRLLYASVGCLVIEVAEVIDQLGEGADTAALLTSLGSQLSTQLEGRCLCGLLKGGALVVLVPGLSRHDTAALATRLRAEPVTLSLGGGASARINLAIGVAFAGQEWWPELQLLLEVARNALAQAGGRDAGEGREAPVEPLLHNVTTFRRPPSAG